MGGLLDEMADGLRRTPSHEETVGWLSQARTLGKELGRVDRALDDAEDSLRLNPRATGLPHASVALRTGLEALEHNWVTVRGLARSIADSTRGPEDPAFGRTAQEHLAGMLEDLAAAMRAYGRMIRSEVARDTGEAENELRKNLGCARRHRDQLAETLLRMSAEDPTEWSLRGELLVHLDRLMDHLRVEHRTNVREAWPERRPAQRGPGRGRPGRRGRDTTRGPRRVRASGRGREARRDGGHGGKRDALRTLRRSERSHVRRHDRDTS
jgi:hypothetical protein